MAKQLTHEQAAKKDNYCPNCGIINYDKNPTVYTCPRCYTEGFECCFPGCATVCIQCEEGTDAMTTDNTDKFRLTPFVA